MAEVSGCGVIKHLHSVSGHYAVIAKIRSAVLFSNRRGGIFRPQCAVGKRYSQLVAALNGDKYNPAVSVFHDPPGNPGFDVLNRLYNVGWS